MAPASCADECNQTKIGRTPGYHQCDHGGMCRSRGGDPMMDPNMYPTPTSILLATVLKLVAGFFCYSSP
eukprot:3913224-Amphidinium_carterae.1